MIQVNDVMFSFLCNWSSFLNWNREEETSLHGKHYDGKQRNAGGVSHLCCQGPAGLHCWCCSLAHLGTWDNWGQQQAVTPAASWRGTRHTPRRRALQMFDDNREGWGIGADPGDYFSPRQEVTSLQLCPRPIFALRPCPWRTRIDAPFLSFSHSPTSCHGTPSCFLDSNFPILIWWLFGYLLLPSYQLPLDGFCFASPEFPFLIPQPNYRLLALVSSS